MDSWFCLPDKGRVQARAARDGTGGSPYRNDGRLREECIQPDERTPQMHALFHAGEAMCMSLIGAVPQFWIKPVNDSLSQRPDT